MLLCEPLRFLQDQCSGKFSSCPQNRSEWTSVKAKSTLHIRPQVPTPSSMPTSVTRERPCDQLSRHNAQNRDSLPFVFHQRNESPNQRNPLFQLLVYHLSAPNPSYFALPVTLELDPINISLSLAGGMLGFINRGQQMDPRGQEDPSLPGPGPALLLFLSEKPGQLPPQRAASPAGCMLPVRQGLLKRWES